MSDPETAEEAGRARPVSEPPPEGDELSSEDYERALSRLHRMSAPHTLGADVEETLRKRSGGRFFGRRAFGDRVPFEVLALLALAIGLVIVLLLRSSQTGSLRYERPPEKPWIAPGAGDVVPQPAPVDTSAVDK